MAVVSVCVRYVENTPPPMNMMTVNTQFSIKCKQKYCVFSFKMLVQFAVLVVVVDIVVVVVVYLLHFAFGRQSPPDTEEIRIYVRLVLTSIVDGSIQYINNSIYCVYTMVFYTCVSSGAKCGHQALGTWDKNCTSTWRADTPRCLEQHEKIMLISWNCSGGYSSPRIRTHAYVVAQFILHSQLFTFRFGEVEATNHTNKYLEWYRIASKRKYEQERRA